MRTSTRTASTPVPSCREVEVDSRGDYIVVEIEDNTGLHTVQVEVTDKIYGITHDANIDGNWYNEYNTARQLRYKNTNSPEVKTGDRVIWVAPLLPTAL